MDIRCEKHVAKQIRKIWHTLKSIPFVIINWHCTALLQEHLYLQIKTCSRLQRYPISTNTPGHVRRPSERTKKHWTYFNDDGRTCDKLQDTDATATSADTYVSFTWYVAFTHCTEIFFFSFSFSAVKCILWSKLFRFLFFFSKWKSKHFGHCCWVLEIVPIILLHFRPK